MILNRWKSFIVVVEEISKDGLARAVGLMMEVKKKVDEEGDKVVYKVADMVVNSVIQKINGKLVKLAV